MHSTVLCSGEEFAALSDQLLGLGCRLRFRASGASMHPFIQDGDVLVVEPRGLWQPRVGDVLFYRGPGGGMRAHRLVRLSQVNGETSYIAKGDNSSCADAPVRAGQLLGRVVAIERGGAEARFDSLPARTIARLWSWLSPWSATLRPVLRRHKFLLRFLPRPQSLPGS